MKFRFGLLGLAMLLALMTAAGAQVLPPQRAQLLQRLGGADAKSTAEPLRSSVNQLGYLSYVGAPANKSLTAGDATGTSPTLAAEALLKDYGDLFYDGTAPISFRTMRVKNGAVRLQQQVAGIPVLGGEMIVRVNPAGKVTAVLADVQPEVGEFLPGGKASLHPGIGAAEAQNVALKAYANECDGLQADTPHLVIFSPRVVGRTGNACLAWQLRVTNPARAYGREVLVHASRSEVVYSWTLHKNALSRKIYDAKNTSAYPGTLRRSEGGAQTGDTDVDRAYDGLGDTYNFYATYHGRDSIDNNGMVLSSTVRYCEEGYACPFANAFWYNGHMYFGQGYATADDVIGHELTHGVTEDESGLIYQDQPGAINESFSDIWGEFIDLTNSWGTDTTAVRWLMGEDLPIGAIRSMKTPSLYDQPDRMSSSLYYSGSLDNGGVHTNSGIGNKLCYLLTDGASFNGQSVTGMGIETVAKLFYEVQTELLSSAADYYTLGLALTQAAVDLGWSTDQQTNLARALKAVEILSDPVGTDNDECATALCMGDGQLVNASSANATASLGAPNCGVGDKIDVWYTYTARTAGTAVFSTEGSNFDTTLMVLSSCEANSVLGSNDDASPFTWSRVSVTLDAGQTVLVRVSGYENANGQFLLRVTGGGGLCYVRIGGIVHATDEAQTPQPGVKLQLEGGITVTSDHEGTFQFTVPVGASGTIRPLSGGYFDPQWYSFSNLRNHDLSSASFAWSDKDVFAPRPNPPQWQVSPRAVGTTAIEMQAVTSSDPSDVYYEFYETTGAPGGTSYGHNSPSYTDDGLQPDTLYRYVYRVIDGAGNITGWSPQVEVRTPPPPVQLLAPNGGETFALGSTQLVTWRNNTAGATVDLQLLRNGVTLGNIASGIANNGLLLWTLPTALANGAVLEPGGGYTIKVLDSANAAAYDEGNGPFTVAVAGGPVLTSPNKGEKLKKGKSVTIKWKMAGGKKLKVRISLYRGGEFYSTITSSTANDGSQSWKPSTKLPSGDYQLVIMNAADYTQRDFADKNVKISN